MHELALTQEIVRICVSHSSGMKITAVELEIGRLSGIIQESVEFCFEACASGTCAEGAQLLIHSVEGTAVCDPCCIDFSISTLFDCCPECGLPPSRINSGEELRVKSIDVED